MMMMTKRNYYVSKCYTENKMIMLILLSYLRIHITYKYILYMREQIMDLFSKLNNLRLLFVYIYF